MCDGGDFGGFRLGAVIAPEIVVVERLQIFINGNDRRTGGIERDGLNLAAGDTGFLQGGARGAGNSVHVIHVGLRGVFGIFAAAMEWIFGDCRCQ